MSERKAQTLAERWAAEKTPIRILQDFKKSEEFALLKRDDDKRLVFGWASIAFMPDGEQLQDRQQDMIDPDDLEEAAYEYVLQFRDTGEEHVKGLRKKGKLVESCVFTKEKQLAIGIPEGSVPVGWWIGFHIDDDEAWEKIKNGTYKMFSIEGVAQREPVEKSAPTGCGVLVVKDGKLLTATRIDGKGRNRIGGPGGHIEQGETPEQAAKRETHEEFGITCNKLVPLGVADGGKYGISACFLCTDFSGDPEADEDEMSDAEWLAPEDMDEERLFLPFAQSLALLEQKLKAQKSVAKTFSEVLKFNPYHDERGRFASSNGYASFTFHTKDPKKQHLADAAVARLKQTAQPAQPSKPAKNYDAHGFADYDDADYHQLYNGKKYYQQQQLTAAQRKAVDSYLESHTEPPDYSYSHSQNLNHMMATGQTLTGKYKQTHDGMMSAMHNLGYNVTLTRYDHADAVNSLLQSLGAGSDYEHMSQTQLQKALVGQTLGENKFISTSYNDFKNAPASSKKVFDTRAVKINYKASAKTQAVMPGIGGGGDLGEIVLAPTNGTANKAGKITGVRLTGQMVRRKGTQRYNQPRIEIDVEI